MPRERWDGSDLVLSSIADVLAGSVALELRYDHQPTTLRGPASMRDLADILRRTRTTQSMRPRALAAGDVAVLEWLNRLETALSEGIFETIGYLDAGDVEGAIAEFNRHGNSRLAGLSMTANSTCTWAFVGGLQLVVDHERVRTSLLLAPLPARFLN